MHKIIWITLCGFILEAFFSPKVYSVVPTPLSLESGASLNPDGVTNSTSPKSASQIADKLEEDQRRLETVLQDLKEDQKALHQNDSKETRDGYSLR